MNVGQYFKRSLVTGLVVFTAIAGGVGVEGGLGEFIRLKCLAGGGSSVTCPHPKAGPCSLQQCKKTTTRYRGCLPVDKIHFCDPFFLCPTTSSKVIVQGVCDKTTCDCVQIVGPIV